MNKAQQITNNTQKHQTTHQIIKNKHKRHNKQHLFWKIQNNCKTLKIKQDKSHKSMNNVKQNTKKHSTQQNKLKTSRNHIKQIIKILKNHKRACKSLNNMKNTRNPQTSGKY